MSAIQDKLAGQIPALREEIKTLVKEHADQVISQVTIKQAYGGVRGVKCLVCDTSEVPPDKGLLIRNTPVGELADRLPEEILWLLLTGELPSADELKDLQDDLRARAKVPQYVWDVLEAMPKDSHPMAMFDTAILVMQKESKFVQAYNTGVTKPDYWVYTLEDALDIIAKLPAIAAGVYRLRFNKGPRIDNDTSLDWSSDYVHMLGMGDSGGKFTEAMRLYFVLHSDHESGNVSAHTTACVNSALSDLYYSLSAGLNGLAGPLHGLANQECLNWILEVKEKFGGVPTDKQLEEFAWETLKSGKVIPGYGHAVLRITDPRFTAFLKWSKENIGDDETVQMVAKVYDVVPGVLKQVKKIADPWPNVDAGSGAILYHFGLTEFPYYTVLFSVSRALGVCSQSVMARAMGWPIERPKSIPTSWIKAQVK
ncbi:MAG: citrate (Si)-synthase [candidate division Zixibacteria bacterium]|nr:citrate (Si)-synthase [candidate division Zixibacteria bacterium]